MEIQCSQFKIRSWKLTDAPSLAVLADNLNIAKQLPDSFPKPYKLEHAEWYVNHCITNHPDTLFAIDVDGQAVGTLGFKDIQQGAAEIGYWLGEPYWGRGIMSEAIGKLLEYGRDHLQIKQVEALVFEGNESSIRALEKNGFQLVRIEKKSEIKAGKAIDKYLYKKSSLI